MAVARCRRVVATLGRNLSAAPFWYSADSSAAGRAKMSGMPGEWPLSDGGFFDAIVGFSVFVIALAVVLTIVVTNGTSIGAAAPVPPRASPWLWV
jgi:hypothetical protein